MGLSARLPHGDAVDDVSWARRHRVLVGTLGALAPVLLLVGLAAGAPVVTTLAVPALPLVTAVGARVAAGRRSGSVLVVLGLTVSCVATVALSGGAGEAYWSFFLAAALLVLYQHWAPLAAVVVAAGVGHLVAMLPLAAVGLPAGAPPTPSSSILHIASVLLAAGALALLCGFLERESTGRAHENATSRLLLDLARRHHDLSDRQLTVLRDLEAGERAPRVAAGLTRVRVLAARLRRDADSLVVLSGRRLDRARPEPTSLREVLRTAVDETGYHDRVSVSADERVLVADRAVVDLTHVVAELVENAARCSPSDTTVQVVARAHGWQPGAQQVVVTDAGPGMTEAERAAADDVLAGRDAAPTPGVGLRVVSRLAARHRIEVSLRATPAGGLAAVLVVPAALLSAAQPGAPRVVSVPPVVSAPPTVPSVVVATPPPHPGRHRRPSSGPVPRTQPIAVADGEATAPFAVPAEAVTPEPGWTGDEWFRPEPEAEAEPEPVEAVVDVDESPGESAESESESAAEAAAGVEAAGDAEADGEAGGPGDAAVVVPSPRREDTPSASSVLPAPREPVDDAADGAPPPKRRSAPLITPKTVPAPPDPSSTP